MRKEYTEKIKYGLKILTEDILENKVCVVIGTRPGIIMFSPIIRALEKEGLDFFVIHTGQHYSYNMDSVFFDDLNIKKPEHTLDTVKYCQYHGEQTAEMLKGIEKILLKEKPKIVLVGGDANTNLAGALAARKLHIQVGHVEGGERSYDWRMPEEHNRRMIDHISDHLFATSENSKKNLLKESVQGKIHVVGNTIVDASTQNLDLAKQKSEVLQRLNLKPARYAILTTHREENVDSSTILHDILEGVSNSGVKLNLPVIFLAHPRTLKCLNEFNMMEWAKSLPFIRIIDAEGYLDFLSLLFNSKLVFTDSGGVQQEACIHHVPAVTLRDNTEWVETLGIGANLLAGTNPNNILKAAIDSNNCSRDWAIPFGDGHAAQKIADVCAQILEE